VLSGIDDHSRYVVVAAVLAVPSARAVAEAFVAAMKAYGVPMEVLTDNGKQFTGRFTKPRPPRCCSSGCAVSTASPPSSPSRTRRPRPGRRSGGIRRCAASCLMWPARSRTCPAHRRRSPPGCTPITTRGRPGTGHGHTGQPVPAGQPARTGAGRAAAASARSRRRTSRAGTGAARRAVGGSGRVRHGHLRQRRARGDSRGAADQGGRRAGRAARARVG
jgi:hypothetical protein